MQTPTSTTYAGKDFRDLTAYERSRVVPVANLRAILDFQSKHVSNMAFVTRFRLTPVAADLRGNGFVLYVRADDIAKRLADGTFDAVLEINGKKRRGRKRAGDITRRLAGNVPPNFVPPDAPTIRLCRLIAEIETGADALIASEAIAANREPPGTRAAPPPLPHDEIVPLHAGRSLEPVENRLAVDVLKHDRYSNPEEADMIPYAFDHSHGFDPTREYDYAALTAFQKAALVDVPTLRVACGYVSRRGTQQDFLDRVQLPVKARAAIGGSVKLFVSLLDVCAALDAGRLDRMLFARRPGRKPEVYDASEPIERLEDLLFRRLLRTPRYRRADPARGIEATPHRDAP